MGSEENQHCLGWQLPQGGHYIPSGNAELIPSDRGGKLQTTGGGMPLAIEDGETSPTGTED